MAALRLGIVLAALAAAGSFRAPAAGGDEGLPALLVVDVSASVRGATDTVLDGGLDRVLVADGARAAAPGEPLASLGRDRTRLADGLALAGELLAGTRRDVLLVTDGRATDAGGVEAARALGAAGHRVFVAPPPVPVADVGLVAARAVAAGPDGVTVHARVVADVAGRVAVTLRRGAATVAATELVVSPGGEADVGLVDPHPPPDAVAYEVVLTPLDGTPDDDVRDDRLVVVARAAAPLVVTLDAGGWPAPPRGGAVVRDGTREDAAWLDDADAVVLAGRPFRTLRDEGAARLAALVARGAVLVVLGGPDGFGPGGWRGTSLERLLPLRSSAPEGGETALVVALDCSGSTGEPGPSGLAALPVLVRALGVVTEAAPADVRLAVLPFADRPHAAPLGPGWVRGGDPAGRRDVAAAAARLVAGGGTDLDAAVAAAAERAAASGARRRRVLLVTDGDPDHPLDATSFPAARAALARGGVELSAVVRGDPRAATALRALAASPDDVAVVDEVAALPEAFLAAFHRALARDEVVRGAFAVASFEGAEGGPALDALAPGALHRLETSPDARLLAAATAPGEPARPFAAVRPFGAGSVVAVAWGPGFEDDADAARRALWPFVAAWAARADRGLAADDAGGRLTVEARAGAGSLAARRGDGEPTTLLEVGPGLYRGPMPPPADDPAAPVVVEGPDGARRPLRLPARPDPEFLGAGPDEGRLDALAAAGRGRRLAPGERPPPVREPQRLPLAPAFALLAVVGFLVERALVASARGPRP